MTQPSADAVVNGRHCSCTPYPCGTCSRVTAGAFTGNNAFGTSEMTCTCIISVPGKKPPLLVCWLEGSYFVWCGLQLGWRDAASAQLHRYDSNCLLRSEGYCRRDNKRSSRLIHIDPSITIERIPSGVTQRVCRAAQQVPDSHIVGKAM